MAAVCDVGSACRIRLHRWGYRHYLFMYTCFAVFCHWCTGANAVNGRHSRLCSPSKAGRIVSARLRRPAEGKVEAAQAEQVVAPELSEETEVTSVDSSRDGCLQHVRDRRSGLGYILLIRHDVTDGDSTQFAGDAVAWPSKELQDTYSKIYTMIKNLHALFPRVTPASLLRRMLTIEIEKKRTSTFPSSALRGLSHGGQLSILNSVFQSDQSVLANSALRGGDVQVRYVSGYLVITENGRESRYSPYMACSSSRRRLRKDSLGQIEEELAAELEIATTSKLNSLEEVQHMFRLLTLRDVLLFPGDRPFLVNSTLVCANAALLVDEVLTDLSHLLPVKEEPVFRRDAKTAEIARLSLFYQVCGIVGSLGASGLVLPRFSMVSFLIKTSGFVYLKTIPQPRRVHDVARVPALHSSFWNKLKRSVLTLYFRKDMNAVDLATVIHNIWCPVIDCFLPMIADADESKRRTIAALRKINLHIPSGVLDLLRRLSSGSETVESILQHQTYRRIGALLQQQATSGMA